MILVTVGTTMPFDELLEEVDRLASSGALGEDLVSQVGQSSYRLMNGEQFVGRPTIADLIAQSSLVITHGGATVVQLIAALKPFIAFANPRAAGQHQAHFLEELATVADISWSAKVADLEALLHERRARGPAVVRAEFPKASNVIVEFLATDHRCT